MGPQISAADPADAAGLAALAATTFPLACSATVGPGDIAAFLDAHLSVQCFTEYLADPERRLLVMRDPEAMIGYAMLVHPSGTAEVEMSDVELSKFYLLPGHHGTGVATALMAAALRWATDRGAQRIWLGVNRTNERAQRFYRKIGFEITGTRTFELGSATEHDFLMARRLRSPQGH